MSGCVSLGATAIMLAVIYLMVRAFTATGKTGNGTPTSFGPTAAGGTQSWGTDPQTGRQITVQVKGDSQWHWATIHVPMAKAMPPGLVIGVRPTPRAALTQGERGDRAFHALVDAMGKSPGSIKTWAIPENQNAVLDAYWKLQQGFQIRGTTISANVPVSGAQDPQIRQAVYVLAEMGQRLSAVASMHPLTDTDERDEDSVYDYSGILVEQDSALDSKPPERRSSVEIIDTEGQDQGKVKWESPFDAPGEPREASGSFASTSSPSPFAVGSSAPVHSPSPFASGSRSPTGSLSPFAAGSSSPSHSPSPFASGSGMPGGSPSPFAARVHGDNASFAPPASQPKSEPELSADGEGAVATSASSDGEDAGRILAAVVREPSSEAQERLVAERYAGQIVTGEGKISFSSTIFGKDTELEVTGGTKVTIEVPVEGAGVLAPKVVLHLETPPEAGALGFGKALRFQGEVKGYRGLGRSLLLLKGRVL